MSLRVFGEVCQQAKNGRWQVLPTYRSRLVDVSTIDLLQTCFTGGDTGMNAVDQMSSAPKRGSLFVKKTELIFTELSSEQISSQTIDTTSNVLQVEAQRGLPEQAPNLLVGQVGNMAVQVLPNLCEREKHWHDERMNTRDGTAKPGFRSFWHYLMLPVWPSEYLPGWG